MPINSFGSEGLGMLVNCMGVTTSNDVTWGLNLCPGPVLSVVSTVMSGILFACFPIVDYVTHSYSFLFMTSSLFQKVPVETVKERNTVENLS